MSLLPRDDQQPDFFERTFRFIQYNFEELLIVALLTGTALLGLFYHIGTTLIDLIKDMVRYRWNYFLKLLAMVL